jgi:hypothetical protein
MASTKIYRTLASNSNSGKLTISCWVRRSSTGEQGICGSWYSGAYHGILYFSSTGTLNFYDYRNGYIFRKYTSAKFNDFGAWYHIVCNFDHTLGSPTGKIYVNGVEQALATDDNYSQGATSSWLTDYTFNVGTYSGSGNYFDGIIADFYFIQGYVYEAATFGETDATTGQWKPLTSPTINYSGTGGNSCHLKFENSANMDLDSGSNNVSFTTSGNLLQTQDNPSHVFCTWNGRKKMTVTLSNGATTTSGNGDHGVWGTIGDNQGKWYWETQQNAGNTMMGIASEDVTQEQDRSSNAAGGVYGLQDGTTYAYYRNNGSSGQSSGFAQITNSAVLCHALDLDNGKYYLGVNGNFTNLSGTASNISSGTNPTFSGLDTTKFWFPFTECRGNGAGCDANFGNGFLGTTAISSAGSNASGLGNFEYDVPAGFTAWSTKGLNE